MSKKYEHYYCERVKLAFRHEVGVMINANAIIDDLRGFKRI